jgi:hypothetical protein
MVDEYRFPVRSSRSMHVPLITALRMIGTLRMRWNHISFSEGVNPGYVLDEKKVGQRVSLAIRGRDA